MRDIITVISFIKQIAENQGKKTEPIVAMKLIQELDKLINKDISFCAPEVLSIAWSKLGMICQCVLGEPNTQWKQNISVIIRSKSTELLALAQCEVEPIEEKQ